MRTLGVAYSGSGVPRNRSLHALLPAAAVDQLADVTRAIYRARHIFILGGALANLALSTFEGKRAVDRVISALVLIAPPLLLAAFLTDPEQGIHSSAPWLSLGQYTLFGAAVLLAGRQLRNR